MTWREWAVHHGRVFALLSQAEMEMLYDWSMLFHRAGFKPEEMAEATDWLALNQPPRYRSDHLAALQARVRETRRQPNATPPAATEASCRLCEGSGRVLVPNRVLMRLELADADAPPGRMYATEAVLCDCGLGRWYREQLRERIPHAPTLSLYEQEHPDWRDVYSRHREFVRCEMAARDLADALDGRNPWGMLVEKILQRLRAREQGR